MNKKKPLLVRKRVIEFRPSIKEKYTLRGSWFVRTFVPDSTKIQAVKTLF